jgi:hypothetical protein
MCKRAIFVLLMVSMISCATLKQNFGTGAETPELKAARSECRIKADKEAIAKYRNRIKQEDYNRLVFDTCMEKKGYDKFGKKVN